jgi:hypothetical protein
MRTFLAIIALVGPFSLFFCGPTNHSRQNYALKKAGTLWLPADSSIAPQTSALFKFDENGREYLSYLNEANNEIIIFDLNRRKIQQRIKCDREGPNGVGRIGGFFYLNKDTIIINPIGVKKLYFINNRAEIFDRFDYTRTTDGKPTGAAHYSTTVVHTPLIRLGEQLYLTNFPDGNYSFLSQQVILDHPLGKVINIKTKQVDFTVVKYPDIWNKYKCSPTYSCIYDGMNFVYLLRYYDQILITADHLSIKTVKLSSKYFDQFRRVRIPPESIESNLWELVHSPCFLNIIYDQYRKFYYIFAYPGIETDPSMDVFRVWKDLPLFSVIILNNEFIKVGEQMMPSNTYNVKNFFVSREGLCISVNHPMNKYMDESRLTFDVFLPVADKGKSD